MSHIVLQKYRTVQPLNDDATVNKLCQILTELPIIKHAELYAYSRNAGRVFIFRHESEPGKVIEYVPDNDSDTSVTTLYEEHPIFESKWRLINVREEIIEAIDGLLLAIPNTTAVMDEERNKLLTLPELGTAQLLDVLAKFSGSSVTAN